jgi:hypothetical protein
VTLHLQVNRRAWNIQRATWLPDVSDVALGGAGGYDGRRASAGMASARALGGPISGLDKLTVEEMFTAIATEPATQTVWAARVATGGATDVGSLNLASLQTTSCPALSSAAAVAVISWSDLGERARTAH